MKRFFIWLIKMYQRNISPYKASSCRFTPTCSNYALTAIQRFGAFRGGLLALWRLLRCNPWGKYGADPVPEQFGKPHKRDM